MKMMLYPRDFYLLTVFGERSDGRTRPTIIQRPKWPITEIAQATKSDVNAAVDAANRAFEGGAVTHGQYVR